MSTTRVIETRRVSFDEVLTNLPKHFAGEGDLIMSHVLAMLSSVFPEGEDFFVRSVRHYRDQIDDPVLKKQVSGFIGQEAMHGREHRALNLRLSELGYPTLGMDKFTGKGLRLRERLLPATSNLAATAALEHYTATLAETLLGSAEARAAVGDEAVQDVLMWHALEEAEHKAVAFDVYRAAGGTERMRRWTMNLITAAFLLNVVGATVVSIAMDRSFWRNPKLLWVSLKRLRTSPFLTREVVDRIRDYNREGFHPDDHETDEMLVEWRQRLFGDDGYLNERLVAKAS